MNWDFTDTARRFAQEVVDFTEAAAESADGVPELADLVEWDWSAYTADQPPGCLRAGGEIRDERQVRNVVLHIARLANQERDHARMLDANATRVIHLAEQIRLATADWALEQRDFAARHRVREFADRAVEFAEWVGEDAKWVGGRAPYGRRSAT